MADFDMSVQFNCSDCGTLLPHNYTQADLHKSKPLEFTCPKCGAVITKSGAEILEMAKQEAIKELKKQFKAK